MAGQTVGTMQREMLIEGGQAQKFLQRGFLHSCRVTKSHVVVDECQNLFGFVVGKSQAPADSFCHLHPDFNVAVKPDAIGSHTERRGLANIMQQRSPSQRHGTGIRQVVQKEQRVNEYVTLRMEFRRLLHSLHRGNLGQNLLEQTALVEKQERATGGTFGQHAGQFIAYALARDDVNLGS